MQHETSGPRVLEYFPSLTASSSEMPSSSESASLLEDVGCGAIASGLERVKGTASQRFLSIIDLPLHVSCCTASIVAFWPALSPSSQPEVLCEPECRLSITHVCLIGRTGGVLTVHVVSPAQHNPRWLTDMHRRSE